MKHLKMLGLAAVAAMALTALFGAGTASATELCAVNTSPCPEASMYKAGQHLEGTSTNTVLKTSGGLINPTVSCTHSTLSATLEQTGGAGVALGATVNKFTFTGCSRGPGANEKCTAVGHTGWTLDATANTPSNGNGTLTGTNAGGSFTCEGLPGPCIYTTSAGTATFTGGNPATVTASNVPLTRSAGSAFGCPPNATWSGTYTVTTPKPAFLVNH